MNVMSVSAVGLSGDHPAALSPSFSQAITVWLMHWKGEKEYQIAAKLGTNALRVDAILKERTHVGSRDKAMGLMTR